MFGKALKTLQQYGPGSAQVGPGGLAPLGAGDDVVEGQILAGAAILAGEAIAEEDVEAGESRVTGRFDVGLQRDHGRQAHLEARTSDRPVVFRDDVHPVEEDRLDGILPAPDRQGIIAQRPIVGIEHEGRTGIRSDGGLDVNCHSTSSDEANTPPQSTKTMTGL